MSTRMRRNQLAPSRRRGTGDALRRWTIPAIGAVTPIGLIVVNIAAFIVHHLSEFRWSIAVLAFVSGLMLNSWTALKIHRVARRRHPEHALLHDRNQEIVLVGALALIIIISFVTALFCYRGLADERDLPNATTFITGVAAIAIPIVLQAVFGRLLRERDDDPRARVETYPSPPPPPGDLRRPR